jgi:hypothetical protein
MMTHYPFCPALGGLIKSLGFKHVLIIRDPRDVAISDAHYMSTFPRHKHYRRFRQLSAHDAIDLVITGFRHPDGSIGLESIGERADNYSMWFDDPDLVVCRFEQLVGRQGGGSDGDQIATMLAVARHVGRDMTAERAHEVARTIWSPKSHTFRRGQIGGWRSTLTPAQRELFKDVAGDALIRIGYADDLSW